MEQMLGTTIKLFDWVAAPQSTLTTGRLTDWFVIYSRTHVLLNNITLSSSCMSVTFHQNYFHSGHTQSSKCGMEMKPHTTGLLSIVHHRGSMMIGIGCMLH